MAGVFKYKTADELRERAQEYFAWADKNPIRGSRIVTKDGGETITRDYQYPRPYSLDGFGLFAGIYDWAQFKQHNKGRDGFADVINYIEATIRQQQVAGAMAGMYKENLVARLNGISENVKVQQAPAPNIVEGFAKD